MWQDKLMKHPSNRPPIYIKIELISQVTRQLIQVDVRLLRDPRPQSVFVGSCFALVPSARIALADKRAALTLQFGHIFDKSNRSLEMPGLAWCVCLAST